MIANADILEWCKEDHGKFHAVLCDPPYELGFMGKSWDSTGVAFNPETWKAISRHLYHGAYLLAFGGTRTFHRIAVAIEDAGFEIRDTVMWVYGSGFPKSHDVSKAIDKEAGKPREVPKSEYGISGWSQGKCHECGKTRGSQSGNCQCDKTGTPQTQEAQRWSGYGTALKPSWEPIIIARLPLEGTVAQNAQKYGSGALNIDGSRIGFVSEEDKGDPKRFHKTDGGEFLASDPSKTEVGIHGGRWPANLIHDGSDEVVGLFPSHKPHKMVHNRTEGARPFNNDGADTGYETTDSVDDPGGSAARFFKECRIEDLCALCFLPTTDGVATMSVCKPTPVSNAKESSNTTPPPKQ